ncbi:MAG: shikimate kinase [Candidatus Eremiobacteraeota bacterium]|nr:shikimate kinase [Candidatus Eremiobacteraeota bacterium]
MPAEGNVYLCGLSGSGKSTVAPLLAQRRGAESIDTDRSIVAEAGISIAELFEREGERGFRDREARAIEAACARTNCVVALGGGALERPRSFERILATGTLVFLDAPLEVLELRLRAAGGTEVRPLLREPGALAKLRDRRLPSYRRANLTVDTAALSPLEVAIRIEEALR